MKHPVQFSSSSPVSNGSASIHRKRTLSGEVVPATHTMPELSDIYLATNIRILVRTGRVGAARTLECTVGASSIDSTHTITRWSSRHSTRPQVRSYPTAWRFKVPQDERSGAGCVRAAAWLRRLFHLRGDGRDGSACEQ